MEHRDSPSCGSGSPRVIGFYEPDTGSCQYIVIDEATRKAALIDIVLEFDLTSARTSTTSAEWALAVIAREGLDLQWILDTHPHADHLMAGAWLSDKTGVPHMIGDKIRNITEIWREIYNLPDAFDPDADFDRLLADGETFRLGSLDVRVMLSPGHTLGSISFVVGDAAFVHDTFMHVDVGTSRADFPGGSAHDLYHSLMAILDLPDETRLFVGHDYCTEGRDKPEWESTVAAQRSGNAHIGGGVSETAFVKLRQDRDATLALPGQMLHALQVNLRGGRLPEPEADGHSYFKIPANRF